MLRKPATRHSLGHYWQLGLPLLLQVLHEKLLEVPDERRRRVKEEERYAPGPIHAYLRVVCTTSPSIFCTWALWCCM